MNNKTVIGISGFARSGKDTLASLLNSKLNERGFRSKIFSFATALKLDMESFLVDKFGISPFTNESDLKSKIRPLLIAYGNAQRDSSKGTYWFNRLKPEIDSFFENNGSVAIIPDLRFKQYEFDEFDFIKSYSSNFIVTVSRQLKDGSMNKAAHSSEEGSFPFFVKNSDHDLIWGTHSDKSLIEQEAKQCIDSIFNFLNSKK
jgi:hypothetical protein